jgi:hypothetical protein
MWVKGSRLEVPTSHFLDTKQWTGFVSDLLSFFYSLFLISISIRAAVHPEGVEVDLPNEGEGLQVLVLKKNQNERPY